MRYYSDAGGSLEADTVYAYATIPERSTVACGVIGASVFLVRLRRKQDAFIKGTTQPANNDNMKTLIITINFLAGATVGYAQGVINWSDYNPDGGLGFSISVFSPGPGGVEQNLGNTIFDLPTGTATYAGVPLGITGTGTGPTGYGNGANYDVGLYLDTTQSAVRGDVIYGTPLATATFVFSTGWGGGWDYSGGLVAIDPTLPGGTAVYVELAAWYNAGGTIGSYAAAVAAGVPAGVSSTSSGTTTLGGQGEPPAVPGTLAGIGITDFSLATAIPEPNTVALGVIGASAFLMRLRRKQ